MILLHQCRHMLLCDVSHNSCSIFTIMAPMERVILWIQLQLILCYFPKTRRILDKPCSISIVIYRLARWFRVVVGINKRKRYVSIAGSYSQDGSSKIGPKGNHKNLSEVIFRPQNTCHGSRDVWYDLWCMLP